MPLVGSSSKEERLGPECTEEGATSIDKGALSHDEDPHFVALGQKMSQTPSILDRIRDLKHREGW